VGRIFQQKVATLCVARGSGGRVAIQSRVEKLSEKEEISEDFLKKKKSGRSTTTTERKGSSGTERVPDGLQKSRGQARSWFAEGRGRVKKRKRG